MFTQISTESVFLVQKPVLQNSPSTTQLTIPKVQNTPKQYLANCNNTRCLQQSTTNNTTSFDAITSAAYSCYYLVTSLETASRGSLLHFVIEARDESQHLMSSGGDFWFATMSTNHPYKASTAGRVIDHNNGTYSVYFYAAWSGEAEIDITLVHPSKAVRFLHDTMWNIGPKVFWNARFQNMTTPLFNNNSFDTLCWIKASNEVTPGRCTYPAQNALGDYVFVCNPPLFDRVCRPLDIIAVNSKKTNKYTDEAAGKNTKYFDRYCIMHESV